MGDGVGKTGSMMGAFVGLGVAVGAGDTVGVLVGKTGSPKGCAVGVDGMKVSCGSGTHMLQPPLGRGLSGGHCSHSPTASKMNPGGQSPHVGIAGLLEEGDTGALETLG